MTYLSTKSSSVVYSEPYPDGTGRTLTVTYESDQPSITIYADRIELDIKKENIDWLIDVLLDIRDLYKETIKDECITENKLMGRKC